MSNRNSLRTKSIFMLAGVVLAIGLMSLPAFAAPSGEETGASAPQGASGLSLGGSSEGSGSLFGNAGAKGANLALGAGALRGLSTDRVLVSSWHALQEAVSNAENYQTIALESDIVCAKGGDRIKVDRNGVTFNIDLNGCTLNRNLTERTANGHVIEVLEGTELTITDSSNEKTGKITGGYSDKGGGIYVNSGATLYLGGVTVTGNKAAKDGGGVYTKGTVYLINGTSINNNTAKRDGGGVYVEEGAQFYLDSGFVSENEASCDGGGIGVAGTLATSYENVAGGTIWKNNAVKTGGGVYVTDTGAIQLNKAHITSNSANDGGGLNVKLREGSWYLKNCEIVSNQAEQCGGGLRLNAGGNATLILEGTTIDKNAGPDGGGGIFLLKGTLEMSGGSLSGNFSSAGGGGGAKVWEGTFLNAADVTIEGNHAYTLSGTGGGVENYGTSTFANCNFIDNYALREGGGIFNDQLPSTSGSGSAGKVTLENCTFKKNHSRKNGGGIYSDYALTIKGATITENEADDRGGGVFIATDATDTNISGEITMEGNKAKHGQDLYLREGKKLTLTDAITGSRVDIMEMEKAGTFTQNYSLYHSAVNPDQFFGTGDMAIVVLWTSNAKEARLGSEWPELQDEINHSSGGIKIEKNYQATPSDTRLKIPGNKSVAIDLNGYTIDRHLNERADNGHVIEVLEGATLTITDSSAMKTGKITGGCSDFGGGIYVHKGATLVIDGAAITGNKAEKEGGGVYAEEGATVYFDAGTISENKASSDGGGLAIDGTLKTRRDNVDGGSIRGNSASETGGGIYVSDSGVIQLHNATIEDNEANAGAGLNVKSPEGAECYLKNCTITNNRASEYGGGLRLNAKEDTKLALEGTTIDKNLAESAGGIYARKGAIEMVGGSISGNSASDGGGGAKVTTASTFTATDVVIKDNRASKGKGGGIKNCGKTALTRCIVVGNTSGSGGGGIFSAFDMSDVIGDKTVVDKSNIELSLADCTISGNTAGGEGGGVYSSAEKATNISGTTVIGPSTSGDGEEIPGNTAQQRGGGIFIGGAGGASIADGLVVEGNTASKYADNAYVASDAKIAFAGKLADGAKLGIDLENGAGIFTKGYTNKGNGAPENHFAVAKGYNLILTDGEVEITGDWASIKSKIENAKNGDTITLDKDYTAGHADDRIKIEKGKDGDKSITVDLAGYTLDRHLSGKASNGHVFEIFDGATLTIVDSSAGKTGTITGGWSGKGGGVYVNNNGTFIFKEGTIAGNKADKAGGGIYLDGDKDDGGTLNLQGGTVGSNMSMGDGGGIYANGMLALQGGTIESNVSMGNGGGVYVDGYCPLNLFSGTTTGNRAEKRGGGIYVENGVARFIKGDPVVQGNSASIGGTDLYLDSPSVMISSLRVAGEIVDGAQVGITIRDDWGPFTYEYEKYNKDKDPAQFFFSVEGYNIIKENGEVTLARDTFGETEYEFPFIEWNDQMKSDTDALGSRNWMAGISGERYLNEINMPGSHDSGMCNVQRIDAPSLDRTLPPLPVSWSYALQAAAPIFAKTQVNSIDSQLKGGARQLDLRLNNCYKKADKTDLAYDWADDGENLWIAHGSTYATGNHLAQLSDGDFLSFKQVLDWVKDFLVKHPTETVILNIRPETTQSGQGDDIEWRAREILEPLASELNLSTGKPFLYKEPDSDSYFARYTHMPQLKDCRGKILLLPKGGSFLDRVGGFTGDMFVDYTDPTDWKLNANEKVAEIEDAYAQMNSGYNSNPLPSDAATTLDYLWYWELNCTGENHIVDYLSSFDSPVDLAQSVNSRLIGGSNLFSPQRLAGQHIGWVRLDDFEAKYAEPIWRTNFFDKLDYVTVTVTSGLNDSKYPDQTYRLLKGTQIQVPGNIYKQLGAGKLFDKWTAIQQSGRMNVKPGETFTINEDVTFEAQWHYADVTPVRIVWKDGDDHDRLRPANVTLTFSDGGSGGTVMLTEREQWSGAVPSTTDDIDPDWDLIVSNVSFPQGQDADGQYRYEKKYLGSDGYVLTFYHTPRASATPKGEIEWDDGDDADKLRPENATVRLLANGAAKDPRTGDAIDPVTVSAAGGWQFDFGDFPQFMNGEKVDYRVTQDPISEYNTTVEGFFVTNTHEPSGQETKQMLGSVVWDDAENVRNSRPDYIKMSLWREGDDPTRSEELDCKEVRAGEYDYWVFDFGRYPVKDASGNDYNYYITVDIVPGYDVQQEKIGFSTFKITNTLIVPDEQKEPAKVLEAPKARALTYSGTDQVLVKKGSAAGGTMMYAPSESDQTAPAEDVFSESLPRGTDVGTYCVWYYVKGDALHTDTKPECATVTIGKRKAAIAVADASKDCGDSDPDFSGVVRGLLEDDDLGEVTYLRDGDDETPGIYEGVLDAKYTPNANYDVAVTRGDFTIEAIAVMLTVRWLDGDGSVLQSKTYREGDEPPAYDGKAPTKAATARYSYAFAGWDGGTVSGATTTYKPTFSSKARKYASPAPKMAAVGEDGLSVAWSKVPGADGYDVYFSRCSHDDKRTVVKKAATLEGAGATSWETAGLKAHKAYKVRIRAYVMQGGEKVYVISSPLLHLYTAGGTAKFTNAKGVKVNRKKVKLSKGKTFKLRAKVRKLDRSKRLMPKSHAARVRYLSSDTSIATVSPKGKIRGRSKGKCVIYVYAHSGIYKKVRVTVK